MTEQPREGYTILRMPEKGIQIIRESLGTTPNSKYSVQLVRSLAVSLVALIVDFGTLILLKQELGVYYLLAAAIGFCLGVVVNYFLSVKWVFTKRQLSSKSAEFIVFFVITTTGLIFNLLIIAGMVEVLHIDYRVGKAVSTLLVFFWNFIARKKVLY